MSAKLNWRNEYKYFINDKDTVSLKHKLYKILKIDPNSNGGIYRVRSLYFDDPFKSGISNKLDGRENRARYRIRQYQNSKLKLECKIRRNQAVSKISSWITKSDYLNIVNSDSSPYKKINENNNVIKKFLVDKKKYALRPQLIVEYDRLAFLVPGTDVRITLDLNVRTYKSSVNLIQPESNSVPVFINPRQQVLEVKFSKQIPTYVTRVIESVGLIRYAISKYALCARYIRTNTWEDN